MDDDDKKAALPTTSKSKLERIKIMKNKVRSVGRVQKMFATLREESELLLKIKNMSPDGKLPKGILLEGRPAIKFGK